MDAPALAAAPTRPETLLIRLSALPLWLEPEVMVSLHGSREEARHALQLLEQLLLLNRAGQNRAVMRPEARRRLLRAAWKENLLEVTVASERLARICQAQAEASQDPAQRFRWLRAALYHFLMAGDPDGWEWLATLFDEAEARGQIGALQQLVEPLAELRPLLSQEERATLALYRARAFLQAGRHRQAERLFGAVARCSGRPTLLGVAHRGLGQTLVAGQRWAEALAHLRQSQRHLQAAGDEYSLALTWLSQGDAYQELADFSGGIVRAERPEGGNRLRGLLRTLVYLPLVLYGWLGRRLQVLPFIDVGFTYQNWAAARLMLAAAAAYRRAERVLAEVGSPQPLYDVRVGLVRLFTRLRMVRRAERRLAALEGWEYVQSSDYRRATAQYWRAAAERLSGRPEQAAALFGQVQAVFERYEQRRGLAAVHEQLGRLALRGGDRVAALEAFGRAAGYYAATAQPLSETAMRNEIIRLGGADAALDDRPREYQARFTGRLARLYRRVTFFNLSALCLLGLAVSLFFVSLLIGTEILTLLGEGALLALLLSQLPLLPAAAWLFQLVYLTLGVLISYLLPLGALERERPLRLAVSREGLSLGAGGGDPAPIFLPWSSISAVQDVEYRLWARPVELISYLDVIAGPQRQRITAMTTGYDDLRRDLRSCPCGSVWQPYRLALLRHPALLLTLLLVLAGGLFFNATFQLGVPDQGGAFLAAEISGFVLGAYLSAVLLFPLVIFWRMILLRWRIIRATPAGSPRPPLELGNGLIYLGALIWSVLTLLFVAAMLLIWIGQGV